MAPLRTLPKTLLLLGSVFFCSCQAVRNSPDLISSGLPDISTQAINTAPSSTQRLVASSTSPLPAAPASHTPEPITSPSSTPSPSSTSLPFYSGPLEIGKSVSGRSIVVHRFGSGTIQRMILAGIHGGYEWNTTKLATRLIELILEDPGLVPSYTTLFILPTLNIDGEARGHGPAGRANENGVDLNRNFPVHWKEDWPRTGCWQMGPITAGEFAISEPETAALVNFLKFHPINALISYHSAGLGIFPGGNQKDPHSIDLAETIARLSPYPYPPLDTGCEHTGTLVDFAVEQGIAAVDIELSTHWDTEIEVNLKVLQAFLKWTPDLEKDLPQLEP